jgi:cation diffusion facilitator CzcD-associated flavoprotein CzcO
MSVSDSVMIIGAGPYGLSIAAHLRARGVPFRIFGSLMHNWRAKMPKGMLLKSDGFASNLSDPRDAFTLKDFALQQGFPYADEGIPIALDNFIAYGNAFQRRFVPELETRQVVALDRSGDGFAARLDNGEVATAGKVVLAIGISDFPYLPASLADAPADYVSHPAQHADMAAFRGRSLAIVGAGSSAIDLAALAQDEGASVTLIMRRAEPRFHTRSTLDRPLGERIRAPNTGIGPGWRSVFYTKTPQLFRHLPDDMRLRIVNGSHGPAGGWYMVDRIVGKVPLLTGYAPEKVEVRDGLAQLQLRGQDGSQRTLAVDHVIAATGYRVDMRKVGFLAERLRTDIKSLDNKPVLSAHFETSVGGLYIVGPASSYSFGPMFRFVYGAAFTAPRVARHLAAAVVRRPSMPRPAAVAEAARG